jgi:hypothetical protein
MNHGGSTRIGGTGSTAVRAKVDRVPYTGGVTAGGPLNVHELPDLTITKVSVEPMDNKAYLLCSRADLRLAGRRQHRAEGVDLRAALPGVIFRARRRRVPEDVDVAVVPGSLLGQVEQNPAQRDRLGPPVQVAIARSPRTSRSGTGIALPMTDDGRGNEFGRLANISCATALVRSRWCPVAAAAQPWRCGSSPVACGLFSAYHCHASSALLRIG